MDNWLAGLPYGGHRVGDQGLAVMASQWRGDICICRRPDGDPRRFKQLEDITFYSEKFGVTVTVQGGFTTDGASVPRAFWWYASPLSGKHAAAALIHDGLYREHLLSRKSADAIFLEAMLSLGVRWGKAQAMHASVRTFGRGPWKQGNDTQHFVRVTRWTGKD